MGSAVLRAWRPHRIVAKQLTRRGGGESAPNPIDRTARNKKGEIEMAITVTTLTGAITSSQTSFGVGSVANIPIPNNQTGLGQMFFLIDQEFMQPYNVVGTVPYVVRGVNGTAAAAHASGAQVQVGLPSDFGQFSEIWSGQTMGANVIAAAQTSPAQWLSGLADVIPVQSGNYILKGVAIDAMTLALPTVANDGQIISIYSDAAFAHTLTLSAAGFQLGLTGGNKTVATFGAFRGAGLTLRAESVGAYTVLSSNGITFS
jgi:hypothetical protein